MENDPRSQALNSGRPADAARLDGDLEESRRLLEEATREWRAVAESLHDLKKALEPGDFAAALAHLNVPGLEGLVRQWRRAQADCETALSAAPARGAAGHPPREDPKARRRSRGRAGSRPDREPGATTGERVGAAAPEPRSASAEPALAGASGTRDQGDGTTEIQQQLQELTNLLRQHVALTIGQDQTSRVEIPRQLTLSIAREVAGRVKDSVLETLRANRDDIDRMTDPHSQNSQNSENSEKKTDKVPLEDVAAMIDQLTRF